MRLYLRILIGVCGVLPLTTLNAEKRESGVWEVLHGCRLIDANISDGDSFKVQHGDEQFSVRLYFVDSPEADHINMDRVRDQARYFSIPAADIIMFGKQAKDFSRKFLRGEFTVVTQWEDARGDKEPRYFALIQKNGSTLSAALVQNGSARIYGMPTKSSWPGGVAPHTYLNLLKQHERAAQRQAAGIWARATGSLQLAGLNQPGTGVERGGTHTPPPSGLPPVFDTGLTGKIMLNTAEAAELETLPGIGPRPRRTHDRGPSHYNDRCVGDNPRNQRVHARCLSRDGPARRTAPTTAYRRILPRRPHDLPEPGSHRGRRLGGPLRNDRAGELSRGPLTDGIQRHTRRRDACIDTR